jgi:hypothetical protein
MKLWMLLLAILVSLCASAQKALPVVLLASEPVRDCPRLHFVAADGAVHEVPLSGTAPGRIFSGTLEIEAKNVSAGRGEFKIVPGTMVDLAGNDGTEITNDYSYVVRIDPKPSTVIYINRYLDKDGVIRKP